MSRGSIILLISIFLLTPSLYYFISLQLNINPSFHFMFRPNMTNNLHNTNNTKPKTMTPPDWVPDQSLLTNWSNTAPILHCPRGSNKKAEMMSRLEYLVESNNSSFCACSPDVTYLLVTNNPTVVPLAEKLYILCGCNYHHIRLDKELWPAWHWIYKVTPVIQWLEEHITSLPPDSYLMYSDAFDSGLVGDASSIGQRFLEYDCEILGMSTVADWPPSKEFRIFEHEKYPWSRCRPHLSAGAWIARPGDALHYLRLWEDDWRKGGEDPEWNDQEAFRRLHKEYYPKFKVDSLARVWTRCDSGIDCI